MTRITWKIEGDRDISGEVEDGLNLMEAAIAHDVPYIYGECGGCLSCATCHVFVEPEWLEMTGPVDDVEDAMLDMTDVERRKTSRLSCQVEVSPELDGLVLHVPIPE
ncbi:MAG: 2Fe-2S iron-sulfur cluster-binding protein [Gammaproteobacteria bacterium]|nr:2Fe-2S iron-sulfur cluster-binding protein [Gammaproteobacteria bacterium]